MSYIQFTMLKHMRNGSIWQIIRDEKIKMTMRYHLREMEKDTIKNPQKYTVGVRTADPLNEAGGCSWCQQYGSAFRRH